MRGEVQGAAAAGGENGLCCDEDGRMKGFGEGTTVQLRNRGRVLKRRTEDVRAPLEVIPLFRQHREGTHHDAAAHTSYISEYES